VASRSFDLPFSANFDQCLKGVIVPPSYSATDGIERFHNNLREHAMVLLRPLPRKLALTALLFALPLSAADAVEANAVADRLKAVLTNQGMDVTWSGVSENGSQIVLEGTTVKFADAPDPAPIGNVTLDGVTEENGGYKIGKVALPAYALAEGGMNFEVSGAEFSGLTLPAEGASDPLASILMYEKANLASVSIRQGDKQLFSMKDLHVDVTPPKDGAALEFSGAAENFTADLSAVEDANARKVIEALGYGALDGNLQMAGTWQPSDGRLDLSEFDISVGNAGTLGMTLSLGGYTPDFVKALQDMRKKMADKPKGANDSAEGLAMLGLMQQLTFHEASIRFDDDSLTGKVLDYVAKEQGSKPADIANQVKAIVPFLLAQLNNPELMKNATEAVTKFLDDPQSIEIKAAPENPVPFALIMAGGMASPQDLPKALGVSVVANEESE
jgi:hypothetical protein